MEMRTTIKEELDNYDTGLATGEIDKKEMLGALLLVISHLDQVERDINRIGEEMDRK